MVTTRLALPNCRHSSSYNQEEHYIGAIQYFRFPVFVEIGTNIIIVGDLSAVVC